MNVGEASQTSFSFTLPINQSEGRRDNKDAVKANATKQHSLTSRRESPALACIQSGLTPFSFFPANTTPFRAVTEKMNAFNTHLKIGDFRSDCLNIKCASGELVVRCKRTERPNPYSRIFRELIGRCLLPKDVNKRDLRASFCPRDNTVSIQAPRRSDGSTDTQVQSDGDRSPPLTVIEKTDNQELPERPGGGTQAGVFSLTMNFDSCRPNKLVVKYEKGELVIGGQHDERQDPHWNVSRQFGFRIRLPVGDDKIELSADLSSDGTLSFQDPQFDLLKPTDLKIEFDD